VLYLPYTPKDLNTIRSFFASRDTSDHPGSIAVRTRGIYCQMPNAIATGLDTIIAFLLVSGHPVASLDERWISSRSQQPSCNPSSWFSRLLHHLTASVATFLEVLTLRYILILHDTSLSRTGTGSKVEQRIYASYPPLFIRPHHVLNIHLFLP
jgi:hypothetical protein